MITVKEACNLIAQFVNMRFPSDRESLYDILNLVAEKIWFSGKFYGSTKWFFVKVRSDGTIITPHGYNKLIGVKPDCKRPMTIKDETFIFHQNGPTSSSFHECNLEMNVQSMGEFPTLLHPEKFFSEKKNNNYIVSIVSPGSSDSEKTARIYCNDTNGNKIYSYHFNNEDDPNQDGIEILTAKDLDKYEGIVEGIDYPIRPNLFSYNNISISSVYKITKEPTSSPVEFWLFQNDKKSRGVLMARLEPNETESLYNLYHIPNKCIREQWVYGLFKISKPQPIQYDSELFLTANRSAIINIAKGIHKTYWKDLPAEGRQYVNQGIRELADELKEQKTGEATIQVNSVRDYSKIPKF